VSSTPQRGVAIVLLAAVADNGVIGRDNALPFRQSSDLKRFKALTMGKPVLMGRKTYNSIGKPLPGRTNIVVSRDAGFAPDGVVDEIVVIGGTDIFVQTMPLAERMEITHVHANPEGDTYFPPIEAAQWRSVACSDHPAGPQDETAFSYVTYARI
jgi:dihydrofolate reductase